MELTEEQKQDSKERGDSFKKDYEALVAKYNIDLIAFPQYIQSPDGTFVTVTNVTLVDKKYLPIKSPFIKEQ